MQEHMTMMSTNNPAIVLLAIIAGFLVYFLPSIVAFHRKHDSRMVIFLINFFLGGTGIGWFIALIWAFS
jgi:hypothetical protein